MGFFREVGKLAGKVTGGLIGGTIETIGELIDSPFIQEVGNGVKRSSHFVGDTTGQAIDGVYRTLVGIAQKDEDEALDGLEDVVGAISRTTKGMYYGLKHTCQNGMNVYEGIRDNDSGKTLYGVKNLAKNLTIGVFTIGAFDVVDVMDEIEANDEENAVSYKEGDEQPGVHHVRPHLVNGHWRDGQWIDAYWRDGDGNTAVHTTEEQGGGYFRTNPDGNPFNNLRT